MFSVQPNWWRSSLLALLAASIFVSASATTAEASDTEVESSAEPMELGWRVTLESLGGAAGGTAGFLLGSLIGIPFFDDGEFGFLASAAYVGLPMALFGVSAATYFIGEAAGGDGNYWWTLLGTTAGAGVAIGLIYLVQDVDSFPLSFAAAAIPPIAGAVLSYELLQNDTAETPSGGLELSVGFDGRIVLYGQF